MKKDTSKKPLPSAVEIREKFIDSTLNYFALESPNFWSTSLTRTFLYRSDFLGKLRLGKHLDQYNSIVDACRTSQFPVLRHGLISATFPKPTPQARDTPKISFEIATDSEWTDALAELRFASGYKSSSRGPSQNACQLIEFASRVSAGERRIVPSELTKEWNYWNLGAVVREAQLHEPRLGLERESEHRDRVVVEANPISWLVLKPLQSAFSIPKELIKSSLEDLAQQVERVVVAEYESGRLKTNCLVIIRTNKRIEARRLFGDFDPRHLSSVFSKVRPTGIDCYWQFSEKEGPWIIAVNPDEGFTWPTVIEAIAAKTSEMPSQQRYGLSSPSAALFDWLRKIPASEFELELSPVLSDEVLVTEIGFKVPWNKDNSMLYFRLLSEEITRKTPFIAVAREWKHYSQMEPRIEFRKREG